MRDADHTESEPPLLYDVVKGVGLGAMFAVVALILFGFTKAGLLFCFAEIGAWLVFRILPWRKPAPGTRHGAL